MNYVSVTPEIEDECVRRGHFAKCHYQSAKKFIKENKQSIIPYTMVTPSMTATKYLMKDGSQWYEFESKLEYPEDDYYLTRMEEK